MKNGFSEVTPIKQKHLKLILETHIACTCAILKRYSWADQTYYYFDINAGPGIDPEGNPGSPLIFLNMATKIANRKFFCVFIEKDLECYLELMENIKPYYIYKNLKIITRYAKHELDHTRTLCEISMDIPPGNELDKFPEFQENRNVSRRYDRGQLFAE